MIEGFDHVGAAGSAVGNVSGAGWGAGGSMQSGSSLITSRWGPLAGRAVYKVGQDNYIYKTLSTGYPEMWFGFALAGSNRVSTAWVYIVNTANAGCAYLARNASGYIELRNAANTVVATSTYNWDGNWHYVEMRVLANGASGSAEVWIDGVQVIASTAGNYGAAGAGTYPAGIWFYNYDGGGGNWWTTYIDDVYALDTGTGTRNGRLGECRVDTLWPTADGSHSGFTPTTAGTHFDEVDDPGFHDSDTTTVASSVVGTRDSYAFGDLSISAGTIYGVGVKTVARKNDVGPRTMKHSIRQGGTTYDGAASHLLNASHTCYQTVWDQDPTAANWTVATVNADEFGVKVEA